MNRLIVLIFNAFRYSTIPGGGQSLRIICVALLLQMACLSKTFADSLYLAAHGPPDPISTLNISAESDEDAGLDPSESTEIDALDSNTTNTTAVSGHASDRSDSDPDAVTAELQSRTDTTVNAAPDWDGIWRDTGILFGSQFFVAGIIYVLPESFSSWSDKQKNNSFNNYAKNVFDPVIDKDEFYINYVLHPYWGATYYIRARERGLDKVPSFIYSTLISAMYEFGVECFFEKPSIQDLTVTPVVGSLVGALIFEPWRESIKRKQELRWYDHAALVLTDPVGVLSLGFEKMFGIKSTIVVNYSSPQLQRRTAGSAETPKNTQIGFTLQFPLN